MNKIYKLKFSRETQDLVAVSELATNTVAGATTSCPSQVTHESLTQQLRTFTSKLRNWGVLTGLLLACGCAWSVPTQAHTGAQVVAGTATIATEGGVTTITNAPNTIINWQQFNIGKNELVQFIQESRNSAVLNRVLGNSVSEILGTLKSNGKVLLINPNGILFGANAMVDTNGLIASTLNLSDVDFQAGKYVFNQEKDRALAAVLNQGVIKVNNDGTLALVGGNVVNTGILEAKHGSVYLLAGQSIQIADLNNPLISFKVTAGNRAVNLGEIVAHNVSLFGNGVNHGHDQVGQAFVDLYPASMATASRITATGQVELFAGSVASQLQTTAQTNAQVLGERNGLAVVNGVIDVSQAQGQAGQVQVLTDKLHVGAATVINATGVIGGTVQLGGDYQGQGNRKLAQTTRLEPGVTVDVSGTAHAGTALVWGDRAEVQGNFRATSVTGAGGLIETSGKSINIGEQIQVNTTSLYGTRGNWLIDPEHLVIIVKPTGTGTSTSSNPNPNSPNPNVEITEDSPANPSNGKSYGATVTNPAKTIEFIYNSTIESALASTDVTLHATSCISGQKFTIKEDNKTHGLTLNAANVILTDVNIAIGAFNVTSTKKEGAAVDLLKTTIDVKKFNITGPANVNITGGSVINATDELVVNTTGGALVIEESNISLTGTNPPISGISLKASGNVTLNLINVAGTNFSVESTAGAINADYIRNNLTGNVSFVGNTGVTLMDTYLGTEKDKSSTAVANVTVNSSTGKVVVKNVKFNATDNVVLEGVLGVEVSRTNFESAKNATLNSTNGDVALTGRTLNATEAVKVNAKNNVTLNGVSTTTKSFTVESTEAHAKVESTTIKVDNSSGNVTIKGNQSAKLQGGTLNSAGAVTVESTVGAVEVHGTKVEAGQATVTLHGNSAVNLSNNAQVQAKDFKVNSSKVSVLNSGVATTSALELGNSTQALNHLVLSSATITAGITKEEFESKFSESNGATTTGTGVNLTINATTANVTNSNLGANGTLDVVSANDLTLGGKVLAHNFTVNSTSGAVTLNHTQVKVAESIGVTSANGAVTLQNNQLQGKAVQVSSNTGLTVSNSNLQGANVTLESTKEGNVQLTNVTANSTSGELKVKATNGSLTIQGKSNLTATSTIDLNVGDSATNNITVVDSQVAATGELKVTTKATANLSSANVSAANLSVDGTQEFKIAGSQLTTTNGLTINATQLTVTDGTTLNSTSGEVSLNATTTVVSGSTVQGNTKVTLKGGDLTVNNSATLNSKEVQVDATGTAVLQDMQLAATEAGKLNATGKTLTLNNVSGATSLNEVTVNGTDALTIQDTQLTAQNLTGQATNGTVSVHNSTLSSSGELKFTGKGQVVVDAGAQLQATGDKTLTLESQDANVTVTNAALNGNTGVTLNGTHGVDLTNANLTSPQLNFTQEGKDLTIKGGVINTTTADLILNTSGKIILTDGVQLVTQGNIDVNSTADTVVLNDVNLNASKKVSITSHQDLQLTAVQAEGQEVYVTTLGKANLANVEFHASQANVTVSSDGDLTITGTNSFTSNSTATDEEISLTSTNGIFNASGISLSGSNVIVAGGAGAHLNDVNGRISNDFEVDGLGYEVNLQQSAITANNVTLNGTNISAVNSEFYVNNEFNATIDGGKGNIVFENTTLNATASQDAHVVLNTTSGNITIASGSQVNATKSVVLNTTGTISVTEATVVSQNEGVDLHATNVDLQGAILVGTQEVNVTSTATQGINALSSILQSKTDVNVNNTHGVQLHKTHLKGIKNVNVTAQDGDVTIVGGVITSDNTLVTAENATVRDLYTTGTDLTLQAEHAIVSSSHFINTGNAKVEAIYDVSVSDSDFSTTNVTINSILEGDVALQGTQVNATTLTLNTTQGAVHLSDSALNITTGVVTASDSVVVNHNRVHVTDSLTLSSGTNLELAFNKGNSNKLILVYPEDSASRAHHNSWSWNERVNPLEEENPVIELDTDATTYLTQALELEDTPLSSWEDQRVRNHPATVVAQEFNALLANPTQIVLSADAQGQRLATVPVQLATAACTTAGQAVLAQHGISAEDLSQLSPLELQRKYQLTAAELATLIASCK